MSDRSASGQLGAIPGHSCLRCGGLTMRQWVLGLYPHESHEEYCCLNCGDQWDQVVLANRAHVGPVKRDKKLRLMPCGKE